MSLERQLEVLSSQHIRDYAEKNLSILNDIDGIRNWQPSDLLPSLTCENDELNLYRKQAEGLSLPVLIVLIGDMITEEGLPTYMSALNRTPGLLDKTGVSEDPWAKWVRGWTAEENRHGDVLNTLLRINPNVNMRAVESTTQHLISDGFDPRTQSKPYETMFYTSFQEWATMLSHKRVATFAQRDGDEGCKKICNKIAGDEARHERFYAGLMQEFLREDPNTAMLAMRDMVRTGIVMPAERMSDGEEAKLYDRFARTAARIGVYNPIDYWTHVEELVDRWKIRELSVSGEAAEAQNELSTAYEKNIDKAQRLTKVLERSKPSRFSWLYGKEA